MQTNQDEGRFVKLLTLMASASNVELSPHDFEIYDSMLSKHGYAQVCTALESMMLERRPGDRFPSVKDILSVVNPELPEALEATDMANRMIAFMRSCGSDGTYYKGNRYDSREACIKANLGELAFAVFQRRGGYQGLYEEWGMLPNSSLPTFRAHLRDTINAVILKAKGGALNKPTALPAPIREAVEGDKPKQLESIAGVTSRFMKGRQ